MSMRVATLATALTLAAAGTAAAQTDREEVLPSLEQIQLNRQRFQLFNACLPVFVLPSVGGAGAGTIGLTRERLQTLVESRLRGARLYDNNSSGPILTVAIGATERAFSIRVRIRQVLARRADNRHERGSDDLANKFLWHARRECGLHSASCVGTPRRVHPGVLAGERGRVRVKDSNCTTTRSPQ